MTFERAIAAATLAAALFLEPAAARAGHRGGVNASTQGADPRRCSDFEIRIDDRPAARGEELLTIPADKGAPLRVEAAVNSGVSVRGADRSDFAVVLCKGAEEAADLAAISLRQEGGALSVRGPAGQDWVGHLLIEAPRSAALDISAENGPVSLTGLAGRVVARSENGPISIRDSSGDIEARAENGPIAARGDGGRLRLATENGPIAVALSGPAWKGEGLDARAVNGPLTLTVPPGYRSGTLVESLGHSPFRCRGEACGLVRRTWDEDRKRLELGEGPVIVKLSTENGPVSVHAGEGRDADED